jgi:hypothetical protein
MTRLDDALGIAAERQHLRSPVRQGLLPNAGLTGITTTRPHNEHAEGVPEISRWQAPLARRHRNRAARTVDPGGGRGRSSHMRAERVGQQARQRWGRASPLNDFKPRSGDISVEEAPVFNGIGVKNVAAPRLVFLFEIDRSQR